MLIYPISICLTPVLMCFILSIPLNFWLEEVKSAMLAETRDMIWYMIWYDKKLVKSRGYWIYMCEELMEESSAVKEEWVLYLELKAIKDHCSAKYLWKFCIPGSQSTANLLIPVKRYYCWDLAVTMWGLISGNLIWSFGGLQRLLD